MCSEKTRNAPLALGSFHSPHALFPFAVFVETIVLVANSCQANVISEQRCSAPATVRDNHLQTSSGGSVRQCRQAPGAPVCEDRKGSESGEADAAIHREQLYAVLNKLATWVWAAERTP
ncbi:hypothetical protein K438DRAFT_1978203 [Mycena galopus ATCC 62051]|nr:hypothetical protein K438DRAFT_1978203 [Mycena galopus ATCC 62051]